MCAYYMLLLINNASVKWASYLHFIKLKEQKIFFFFKPRINISRLCNMQLKAKSA